MRMFIFEFMAALVFLIWAVWTQNEIMTAAGLVWALVAGEDWSIYWADKEEGNDKEKA